MFSSSYCFWFFTAICVFASLFILLNGARVEQVDEHHFSDVVVCFEFEAYPEPKVLSPLELQALYDRYKNFYVVGDAIGASESFVRQNVRSRRSKKRP